jgi:DNA-binding transcriptional ArsR family regulator
MESVFATIADPTRRRILEVLRTSGPLSVKALADPLPMSRQAVTKHLDILSSSGLIQIERVGRERLHRLEPHSLREVADWLKPYEAFWDTRLARLKRHLDEKED